ncbi:two-component sensor histidine kinase [Occultella glacieicola]|uniref:histidine kinase n=1 Tax=Occultella glacieicola TaxID=2518684 RepID=A0ABY2E616_9MICO|nr:histidine kinase [Occultella glacieicola]TDE95064.1 two-component sensor histidine kinase [Occultella glacieicola]
MSEMAVGARRPPVWRTVLLIAVCMFASLTSAVFSEWGQSSGQNALAAFGVILIAPAVPLVLLWRHRAPMTVALVAAGLAILVPIGASTALVALASLIARRSGRRVWYVAGAVALALTVTAIRDLLAETMAESFLKTLLGPLDAPPTTAVTLSWWVVPIAVAVALVPAIGIGLLLRARRASRAAEERAQVAGQRTEQLGDELARQVERERIAREVHDVLGHRLSLLNLHAGALEVNAQENDDLARSAALVRSSAGQSVEDLRSLLSVLRQDPGADHGLPEPSLVDLPGVIDETVRTGVPVSATVYLDQAESADPTLARAVYRIVQELLTNARKHAPGQQIRLAVTGGPSNGISIDARNPYRPPAGGTPGRGLQGIAERVELLGGRLQYGVDDGGATFRVTVTLPWREVG